METTQVYVFTYSVPYYRYIGYLNQDPYYKHIDNSIIDGVSY